MKKVYWFLLFLLPATYCLGQKNLNLLYHYSFSAGTTCAGVWHYNDSTGHEYALVGTSNGLSIFDITNPVNSQRIFDVPDTPGLWREVKVWSHYCYVSNEGQHGHGGGGITIVDLSNLPDTPVYKKYTGDSAVVSSSSIPTIAGKLSTAHTVQAVDGYLYINGSNIISQGTLICSLADPWNPKYSGAYNLPGVYVHDCFVRGDTLITSEIYKGQFTISIMSANKDTITPIVSQSTPSLFNHSSWMSDNDHYLFTTDEKPNAPLASYDISDLQNITLLALYRTKKNPVGEVHNPRVLNDFLVCSDYGDSAHTGSQVTLVDVARPANLIEVGNYQLCAPDTGLMICWDADPFASSGNIVATEGKHGFYVFAPTYIRACYLEGSVTDCTTGFPLNDVHIEILMPPADTLVLAIDSTMFTGNYVTGLADSGTYDVRFIPSLADSAYAPKTITGVTLKNGILTSLNPGLCKGPEGIYENTASSDLISVYPNPATEQLAVSSSLFPFREDVTVSVINVLGQEALPPTLLQKRGESTFIDISKLPAGVYFLQMKSESGIVTKKFVKE